MQHWDSSYKAAGFLLALVWATLVNCIRIYPLKARILGISKGLRRTASLCGGRLEPRPFAIWKQRLGPPRALPANSLASPAILSTNLPERKDGIFLLRRLAFSKLFLTAA